MKPRFDVVFLQEAIEFLESMEDADRRKLIYNIDKSRYVNDPRLFKMLRHGIWEFRTRYGGRQYRLLAFWDKRNNQQTLVVATHGMIKKASKVPGREIEKALRIRMEYLK